MLVTETAMAEEQLSDRDAPLGFVTQEELALGIVANDVDVDEGADVQALRSQTRGANHDCDGCEEFNRV